MSKKTGDLFEDDAKVANKNDFAKLLEQSLRPGRDLRVGATFKGEILALGKDEAFVATETPVDGALPIRELLNEKKELLFKVGDRLDVTVVRLREGEILLRRASSTMASEVDSLEDAFDMELPVEGKVTESIKGGFRVMIQGKAAFCPIGQMDLRFVKDPSEYVGQRFEFILTQYENGGRNIVVSRRKVLELQRAEYEGEFLKSQKSGDILSGQISRIEKFGAFVSLAGGVEGLIPISELSWGRIQNPSEVVSLGQSVSVKLLKATEEEGRLKVSLSLKQAGGEGDPWFMVVQKFPVGTAVEGTVEKKENYGLFVQLAPGMSGLLPRSKWRDRIDGQQYDNKIKGDKVKVVVSEIKFEERKLTLGPFDETEDEGWRAHNVQTTGFGTLADLLKNVKPRRE